jgi:hypothetical protein
VNERIEKMKRLMTVVLSMVVAAGMAGVAVAGNIDSPGAPSSGSGMYTLQNLYDYLISGTALTVAGSFQEPTAGPASTMKSTKQIGDDIKAQFDQCDAVAADVQSGKKFFCTQSGSWGVQTGTASGGGVILVTGQTTSYLTGDDGYYEKGTAYSYTDNGDGTVTDNVTGLMWVADGSSSGCANGGSRSWSAAVTWAENLTYASYSDWRLPNVRELLSLSKIEGSSPHINTTFFPNTAGRHWASSTYPLETGHGFFVTFDGGDSAISLKTTLYRIKPVRGGS